jgi:hypothetical protein
VSEEDARTHRKTQSVENVTRPNVETASALEAVFFIQKVDFSIHLKQYSEKDIPLPNL